jgi:mono/diheme cytochrome c family protein
MRYVYLITFFVVVLTAGVLGYRGSIATKPPLEVFPDMDRMPKYKPQAESAFFADGRSDRPIPTGTVARGQANLDSHLSAGRAASGEFVRGFPVSIPVDNVLMARGKERFDIYCAVCHGQNGDGKGIVAAYGWGGAVSFHNDLYRAMPEGELYNTVTNGKNTMMGYGDKLDTRDRWAVVAYLRALQRAHNGKASDVPQANKAELGIQ